MYLHACIFAYLTVRVPKTAVSMLKDDMNTASEGAHSPQLNLHTFIKPHLQPTMGQLRRPQYPMRDPGARHSLVVHLRDAPCYPRCPVRWCPFACLPALLKAVPGPTSSEDWHWLCSVYPPGQEWQTCSQVETSEQRGSRHRRRSLVREILGWRKGIRVCECHRCFPGRGAGSRG